MQDSKFYFGDLAINPNGDCGEVIGIWLKTCIDGQERWVYRLKGLKSHQSIWWQEAQLKRPSEVRHANG